MRVRSGLLGALLLLVPLGVVADGPTAGASTPGPATCGGTVADPATLPGGTYSSLIVTGVCDVSAGTVTVDGNVTVVAGAALVSAFALDDGATGTSSGLTVEGDVTAATGASLVLGCEHAYFACLDDPDQATPTLTSVTRVAGDVTATDPLGVVLHQVTVGGDLQATGGGGGTSCTSSPSNVFSTLPASVVYSDLEDDTVGGDVRVTGLSSCWFAAIRNTIGGSATFSDITLADPDGNEILHNYSIGGNMICEDDTPAVQWGDAGQPDPSIIGGYGAGQCALDRVVPYGDIYPQLHITVHDPTHDGYWLAAGDGGIFSYSRPFLGSAAGGTGIVGIAGTPGGRGYALATSSGRVETFGAGSCSGAVTAPTRPIVGIAAVPGGGGCWTDAADGGVFSFGAAPFYGSAGSLRLDEPIVGMAPAADGDGYWLVASDGGIFSYGPGATFHGSMGGRHLDEPIVGMATDPATGGYWLVASDGGIFAFDAPFLGSMGGRHLNRPIVGMAAAPDGDGYYLVASDGGIFAFGSATFEGSAGSLALAQPIVGMSLG